MSWEQGITVIIPTYKRPKGLESVLTTLVDQKVTPERYEIIISDNDPNGGAADYVKYIASKDTAAEIIYVHAKDPGVCNARNAAMEKARGRFLVFVDDDMEATEGWVQNMIDLLLKYDAGIAFSDVTARMHDERDPKIMAMVPIFSRTLSEPEGLIKDFLGMGGAALDTSLITFPDPPFNPAFNDVGGEDDFLFYELSSQGVKVAWSPHFSAYEIIPESRATFDYVWKRNFAFGQGPTQLAADRGIKGIPKIIYWMMVGAAQMVVFGAQYLTYRLLGRDDTVQKYARLSQAIGKMLWWDGFKPRLYGENSTTEQ
ncbi:MAG: glycosyltransferase family 2 protein [Maricaulaceae bacterium]